LHALDASSKVIHRGLKPSPSLFHPQSIMLKSLIFFWSALHQMLKKNINLIKQDLLPYANHGQVKQNVLV
jgi:hypothetical protein